MEALIVTMCAGDPDILNRVRVRHVILRAEKFIGRLPWVYIVVAKIALYLVEYAVPPLAWKLRPFSRLPLEAKLNYLEGWWTSRFYFKRMIFKMLTSLCVPEIYSERRLLISLGYGPALQHRRRKQHVPPPGASP